MNSPRGLLLVASLGVSASLIAAASADGQRAPRPLPPNLGDVKTAAPTPVKENDPARAAAAAAAPNRAPAPANAMGPKPPATVVPHPMDFSHVYYDEPGDGSLWALGKTYKCSFGADGFTMIPFLGSDAPKDYPVKFTLTGIDSAGKALPLTPGHAVRDGDRVVIDHGIVQEVYLLTPTSVEQQFTFSQRPGSADVTIHLGVESELSSADIGSALKFSNELGGMTYSKAVTVDAHAQHTDSPTTLRDGRTIDIVLPQSMLAAAAYPIVVDPTLDLFSASGSVGSDANPDISYDSTNDRYTIVWDHSFSATDGDVYSELYFFDGTTVTSSNVQIDFTGANWRKPRVANCGIVDRFLVVAEVGAAGARQVWGRTRDAGSNTVSGQFQISDGTFAGEQYDPDVGGDPYTGGAPVYFCVVWQRDASPTDKDVLGRLVDSATSAISGGVILIENSFASVYTNPSISKSDNSFTWEVAYQFTFSATDEDIYGAQLDYFGNIISPNFAIDASGSVNTNPAISGYNANGDYMCVYEEGPATLGDIWGRVFNGTTIVGSANLTTLENATTDLLRRPAIDNNADHFTVAYEQQFAGTDWDVYQSTYCYTGTIRVSEQHRNLNFDGTSALNLPRVVGTYGAGTPIDPDEFTTTMNDDGFIIGAYGVARNTCCKADIAPNATGNGVIDVNDLLAVVTTWGSCANFQFCQGDINGDFTVNVNDLLAVVSSWGPCP